MKFMALLKIKIDRCTLFPALNLITFELCWVFMLVGALVAEKGDWTYFGMGFFSIGVVYLVFTVICGMILAMLRESRITI